MALITLTTSQRNRRPYVKTLLLSTTKILDFRADDLNPTTKTLVYYLEAEDGREQAVEYIVDHHINVVTSRARRATNEPFFYVHVLTTQQHFGREKPEDKMWKLNADRIVKGYDNSDGLTSYVTIERGAFKTVRIKTSHLVAEIAEASSQSRSLSAS